MAEEGAIDGGGRGGEPPAAAAPVGVRLLPLDEIFPSGLGDVRADCVLIAC